MREGNRWGLGRAGSAGVRRGAALTVLALLSSLVAASPAHAQRAPSVARADAQPLAGLVIALDPGHQLGNGAHPRAITRRVWAGLWKQCNTTGTATNTGFPEATFTWRTALALRHQLRAIGATVRLTRSTNSRADYGPCVDARGEFGAKVGADLEISLHGDGLPSSVDGFVVIRPGWRKGYTDDIAGRSHRLARAVHHGLHTVGFPSSSAYGGDGYDVRRDLGTLNMADIPTVMVELGNMRNGSDARCMTSERCRDRYAAGLTRGVVAYLGTVKA